MAKKHVAFVIQRIQEEEKKALLLEREQMRRTLSSVYTQIVKGDTTKEVFKVEIPVQLSHDIEDLLNGGKA